SYVVFEDSRMIVRVDEQGHGVHSGPQFAQRLKPLRPYLNVQCRHAGEIATRSVKAGDKSVPDRVASRQEDDWDGRGRRLCGQSGDNVAARCNHVHLTADQIGRKRWEPIVLTIGPAVFDCYSLALNVARFIETKAERAHNMSELRGVCGVEKTNCWHGRLL